MDFLFVQFHSTIKHKNIILHKIEGAVTKQPLSYILISF